MNDSSKRIYEGEDHSFPPFDRVALARLITMVVRPGCRMAEIGSWLGVGSTQVFIENLAPANGTVFCVDTWLGSPNVTEHQAIVAEYDVLGTFLRNADSPVVKPVRMKSAEAARTFADGFFDLVFIDGDHSYTEVMHDIIAWKPKVRSGGILCGHDCEIRVTSKNFDILRRHREVDVIPSLTTKFLHVHPGSVLAVHETLADQVNLFSDEKLFLATGRQGYSCVWWARMQ